MRFILLAKATKNSEKGVPPKPELMTTIGQFGSASRVRTAKGKMTVTDVMIR